MLNTIRKQLQKVEKSPGIYIFRDKGNKIIYIGKAIDLRSRTKSYFVSSSRDDRPLVPKIRDETKKIETIPCDSELEAVLLEAELIRKNKPKYNVRQKDDKSFIYLFIDFSNSIPKVSFIREKELIEGALKPKKKDKIFGPFLRGKEIRKLLSYLRKIIPYRDCSDAKFNRYKKIGRGCQWQEISRCDAPCIENISVRDYRCKISQLSRLLKGSFKAIEKEMIKEMRMLSEKNKFEEAAAARDRIKALGHIKEISLIDINEERKSEKFITIEALDISNISGKEAAGSIIKVVVYLPINPKLSKPDVGLIKDDYRRFKIYTKKTPDDIAMIKEVVRRRFKHKEWPSPDVFLIDGGKGQLNAVKCELKVMNIEMPVVAIAKGVSRKGEKLFFSKNFDEKLKKTLSQDKRVVKSIRDEAHRFAIIYHRLLRKKNILRNK